MAAAIIQMWKASDGVGSIEVMEVFGNDLTVVNSARVSFAKESHELTLGDEKLIKYLAAHNHISPFFHPQIRLRIKMPIFVAREWFRHQIGLSRNEVSRRYVDSVPEVWCPSPGDLRERDPNAKQGSKVGQIGGAEEASLEIREHCNKTIELYSNLLEKGVAPEVARCVLPQGMYTEFIETGSLAAYARIAKLRTDPSAQREIQLYARGVMSLLTPHFPVSWAALTI